MKTNEKYRNNNETWWKIEKQEWTMMKKEREKQQWEMMKKRENKQWKMMKNKEKTMKHDEK